MTVVASAPRFPDRRVRSILEESRDSANSESIPKRRNTGYAARLRFRTGHTAVIGWGLMKARKPLLSSMIALVIGLLEFSNIARNPRFEAIHTVDVVGLLGCGACFGVALTALFAALRSRRAE